MTNDTPTPPLERKDVQVNPELTAAFSDFMGAFEAFKETNDRRLAEVETKLASDVVTVEKLARLDRALDEHKMRMDELVLRQQRPPLMASHAVPAGVAFAPERKAAFDAYMRSGNDRRLREIETKALTGADTDAGFLVPEEIEREVMMRVAAISPIRSIAGVQQVSSPVYKRPFSSAGPATGWVAETDARTETAAPTLQELTYPTMELYAMPAATATLLEDSAVNIDEWLATEVEVAFAEQEGAAFVNGNGTNKPTGFMAYDRIAEASWEWGKIGYIVTGVSAGFPAADAGTSSAGADALLDLVYAVKAGYRQNASFVMNRKTQAAVRKLKDAEGSYLWTPPSTPGGAAALFNFPVVEVEDMPNIAANECPIAFGDFKRGYLIVDRAGLRILRDPYSAKPYVLFYVTKRVGGGMQDFDAIKLLKFGTA